jgi:hypothetical protein
MNLLRKIFPLGILLVLAGCGDSIESDSLKDYKDIASEVNYLTTSGYEALPTGSYAIAVASNIPALKSMVIVTKTSTGSTATGQYWSSAASGPVSVAPDGSFSKTTRLSSTGGMIWTLHLTGSFTFAPETGTLSTSFLDGPPPLGPLGRVSSGTGSVNASVGSDDPGFQFYDYKVVTTDHLQVVRKVRLMHDSTGKFMVGIDSGAATYLLEFKSTDSATGAVSFESKQTVGTQTYHATGLLRGGLLYLYFDGDSIASGVTSSTAFGALHVPGWFTP